MAKLYADNILIEETKTGEDILTKPYIIYPSITGTVTLEKPRLYICEYCDSISEIPGICPHCGAPVSLLKED